jgi:hypothetical protein
MLRLDWEFTVFNNTVLTLLEAVPELRGDPHHRLAEVKRRTFQNV